MRCMLDPRYKDQLLRAVTYIFPTAKVYLFGSRAIGTAQPTSDIDIAIDIGKRATLLDMEHLRVTIENTTIPLKVDVVDLHTIPPDFKEEILKTGILWKS